MSDNHDKSEETSESKEANSTSAEATEPEVQPEQSEAPQGIDESESESASEKAASEDATSEETDAVTEKETSPEPEVKAQSPKTDVPVREVVKVKRGFPWFTSFVFVLVIALTGAIAYVVKEGQDKLAAQNKNFESIQDLLNANAQSAQQNITKQKRETDQKQKQLQAQLKKAQTEIGDLNQRLNAQSKRLHAMSDTSRDDWLLAEAEYLLKLANQRVRIERSPAGADALLEEADGILRDLDDTNLHGIRRAIAKDLAALRLLKTIDVEGIYLNLIALTDQIENIPVRVVSQLDQSGLALEQSEAKEEKSVRETISDSWRGFIGSFKDYVRVVHHDEKPKPLLPVQDQMYLQQNLRLMLERAQLALLREQQDIFSQSLHQADDWLVTYYNDSEVLQKFRAQLSLLKGKKIVQELPDISGSLQQLHDYIAALHDLKGVATPRPSNKPKTNKSNQRQKKQNAPKPKQQTQPKAVKPVESQPKNAAPAST